MLHINLREDYMYLHWSNFSVDIATFSKPVIFKVNLLPFVARIRKHNDSLWDPLHTKEGDEISMFWGPCLPSSISTLSFGFFALFFCYTISSCVYDHNHPYLVSERLFLAENKAFPYLRRALAHPRRALAILWDAAATWRVVIFVVVAAKQRSPK